MTNRVKAFVLMGIVTLLGLTIRSAAAQGNSQCDVNSSDECAAADQVGVDVQSALKAANGTGLSGLTLKKAVLTLETGTSVTGGININFLIFTVKHQTKKADTISQQITWGTVQKPAGGGPKNLASLTDVLSKAIATSAAVASKVTQLPLASATVKIQFVVDKTNGAGLSYEVVGVNLGPNVNLDKTSTNTLEVTFSK